MSDSLHAPHVRSADRTSTMSLDVLVAILPLCIFSAVSYGIRPCLFVLAGIASAILCESLCCLMMRRPLSILDGTAAVTGALCGVLMSPIAPFWMPMVAAAFAILVVKMPFGGAGRNLFNPAAAGIAVMTQCFSYRFFTYPDPDAMLPMKLGAVSEVVTASSPAAIMQSGGSTTFTWPELLLGQFPGPIGATAILVLCACMLYLFFRRAASPWITLPYLVTCAVIAALFPRVSGGAWNSVLLELCSGYLLFCGIFLLTDPVTSPGHWFGRLVYGVLAGVLVMLLRHIGRFEEGACFAVLLLNACSTLIDRHCWQLTHFVASRLSRFRKGGETA